MDRSVQRLVGRGDPKGEEEVIRRALRTVRPRRLAGALEEAVLGTRRPSAALAGMSFVRWAEQACRARLPPARRAQLESIQAYLLAWGVCRDREIDADGDTAPADIPRLYATVDQELRRIFPRNSPFWTAYRRLSREQATADRLRPSTRFDPALIRRLGHKSALGRWPAAAVAELLGRPRCASAIDRDFDDLLAALQLFDDVVDAEDDARAGRVNAVLAAARPGRDLHARIVRGIPRVCSAARGRLGRLASRPGPMGRFAGRLLAASTELESRALHAASWRGLIVLLEPRPAGPVASRSERRQTPTSTDRGAT